MTSIIMNNGHYLLAINGMPDHVHLFFRYQQTQTLPKLIQEVKTSSDHFIKRQGYTSGSFKWQKGYGAFSYSQSQVDRVIKYILRQEEHHRNKSFKQEYLTMLQAFQVEYQEQYLFDFTDISYWE